jgi:hypothetical protein
MALALALGYYLPDLLVPPEDERLEVGGYSIRPGFVHDWARGAIVMYQTFDMDRKALPPRVMGPRQLPVLSYDTKVMAIMRELDQ